MFTSTKLGAGVILITLLYLVFWTFFQPFTSKQFTKDYITTYLIGIVLLIINSFTLNLWLLLSIYFSEELRFLDNCPTVCIATANLLFTLTSMPLKISTEMMFLSDMWMDSLLLYLKILECCVIFSASLYSHSVLMLSCVQVWKICRLTTLNDTSVPQKGAVIITFLVFLYSISVTLVYFHFYDYTWVLLFDSLTEYFIPITGAVITCCATYLLKKTSMEDHLSPSNSTIVAIVISLLLFRAPTFIVLLIDTYVKAESSSSIQRIQLISQNLFYLNCCVAPIIMGALDNSFRRSYLAVIRKLKKAISCRKAHLRLRVTYTAADDFVESVIEREGDTEKLVKTVE